MTRVACVRIGRLLPALLRDRSPARYDARRGERPGQGANGRQRRGPNTLIRRTSYQARTPEIPPGSLPGYPFPEETRREEMFAVVAAEQDGEAASAAGASVD